MRILFLYAFVNTCVAIAVSKQALHKAHWEIPDCAPLVLPREALKVQIWITYTNFRYFYVTVTMDNRKTGCLSIIHVVTITGLRVQGAMLVGKDKSDSLPSLITFRWKKRKLVWHVNKHGRLVTWLQSEYCSVSGRATVRHFDPFNLMTYHYKNIFFIKRLFYLNYLIILMSIKG